MTAPTKERIAEIRRTLEAFGAIMGRSADSADPIDCAADLLAALDAAEEWANAEAKLSGKRLGAAMRSEETARTEAAAHDAWQARAERAERLLAEVSAGIERGAEASAALAALTGDDRAEAAIGNLVRDRRLQIKRAEKAEAERDEAREQKAQLAREFMRDEVAKLEARIEAAYVERDKARATVSGLVEAVTRWRDAPWSCSCDNCAACAEQADSKDALDAALSSSADLAARTRAAIRAEALREAADVAGRSHMGVAAWLRELAAKETP